MSSLVLGIDVGSTSTKVVLAEPSSEVLAQASAPAALSSPHPGWAEADPAQWWRNVCALVPQVLGRGRRGRGHRRRRLHGDGARGHPGGRDRRRAAARHPAERRAGHRADPLAGRPARGRGPGRGHRLGAHPAVGGTRRWPGWPSTSRMPGRGPAHVLGSYDWLAVALGAAPHVEQNWALESGLFALAGFAPIDQVLRAARISADLLPPVVLPGTRHWLRVRRRGGRDRAAGRDADRGWRRRSRAQRLCRRAG